ncbi:MAG: hypothetical protein COS94_01930 [Candidatus Hydrogenedentes bacterium CG07_land_8_20_14_0_80_42_17]|nr:MAG: hypothetical protein COS94_01930 [Candidatus Hydrogenedentes bacterium CG07_land_8_20_14_0_80_42_17]
MKSAFSRRIKSTAEMLKSLKSISDFQKANSELSGAAKLGMAVSIFREGLLKARNVLSSDREALLREDWLRDYIARYQVTPKINNLVQLILKDADKDRAKRQSDVANMERGIDQLGALLSMLISNAAADPSRQREAAQLVADGLGMPINSVSLPYSSIKLVREDLGWRDGTNYTMMRTVRGREDFRVPVEVKVKREGNGYTMTKEPIAFDSALSVHLIYTDTAIYIDNFENVAGIDRSNMALFYRFPLAVGDSWIAWKPKGFAGAIAQIVRSVTAAERIITPQGEFDCLRIETRMKILRNPKMPLIYVEWIAKGIGQVKEMAFRQELKSIAIDERIKELLE